MRRKSTGIKGLDSYCAGVRSGKILVCDFVKKAVDRHYRDLERQGTEEFPYYFDKEEAQKYIDYFPNNLCHYEGPWKGKPFVFEPWQEFAFGSPFGWYKTKPLIIDGEEYKIRRFKEIIIEIPKKQGKSIWGGGTALYGLEEDGEAGAQIYGLASSQKHAMKLSYRAAKIMVERNADFASRYKINMGAATMGIQCKDNDSFFEPLIAKPESIDGLHVHMCINDETKDWDDFEVYNIMKEGTSARLNPITINITTAGSDRGSLGYERREYLIKVLDGTVQDETTFGLIYTIDKEDRYNEDGSEIPDWWANPDVWRKCTPNYNISVFEDFFIDQIAGCKESQIKLNSFLTKRLNIWISADSAWMNMDTWGQCNQDPKPIEYFKGKPCYVGLDLAQHLDLCSMYMIFMEGKKIYVYGRNYLPKKVVEENLVGRRAVYNAWRDNGDVVLTNGSATDYEHIYEDILEINSTYQVMGFGFDPTQAIHIMQRLEKSRIKRVQIPLQVMVLSEPMKKLQWYVEEGLLEHGNDPVLTWAVSNVVAHVDKKDNIWPNKEHADNKIDPVFALIIAIAQHMKQPLRNNNFKRFGRAAAM